MDSQSPLELEHVIGYTGRYPETLRAHSMHKDAIIFSIGAVVVIGDLNDPHKQEFLRGHDEEICYIQLSKSGRFCATGQLGSTKRKGGEADILIWDLRTEKAMHTLRAHTGKIDFLAFSHDDRFLASIGSDNRLCIWDTDNGQAAGGSKIEKIPMFVVWITPDDFNPRRPNYRLVVGYNDHVRLCHWDYDIRTMQFTFTGEIMSTPVGRGMGFIRNYHSAIIDETQTYCYAGTSNGEIIVFNTRNLIYRTSVLVSKSAVGTLCCLGDTIFAGSYDGSIYKVVGADQHWQVKEQVNLRGRVTAMSMTQDKQALIAGTADGKMYSVLVSDMTATLIAESHIGPVTDVAFNSNPEYFCTSSLDGTVRCWDLVDYTTISIAASNGQAMCCNLTDENTILTGWDDGFIRAFDVQSGKLLWQIVNAHRGPVSCLSFDSRFICSAGEDSVLRLWSTRDRAMIGQYSEHTKPVTAVHIDDTNASIIHSCSLDKTVFSFDTKSQRKLMKHVVVRDGGFTGLAQSKIGEKEIITVGTDGKIMFWDIDYPNPVRLLTAESNTATTAANQSARGRNDRFAAGPSTSPQLHGLNRLNTVSVSNNGRYLAVAGDDQVLQVWELERGSIIAQGVCHSAPITKVKWSPDDKQLISVGNDCAICVWNFYA